MFEPRPGPVLPITLGVAFAIAVLLSACANPREAVRVSEKNLGDFDLSVMADVVDTGIQFRFSINDGYLGAGDFWIVTQDGSEARGQDTVFLRTQSRDEIKIELRNGSRTIYSKTIALPDSDLIGEIRIDPDFSVSTSWHHLLDESSDVAIRIACTSDTGPDYDQGIFLRKGEGQTQYHFSAASGSIPGTGIWDGGNASVVAFSDVTQSYSDSAYSLRVDFSRPLMNAATPFKYCVSHVVVYYTRYYPTENVFKFEEFSLYHAEGESASIQLDTLVSPAE
jgi:hypothetical protein